MTVSKSNGKISLSNKDLSLLNSKIGLKYMFASEEFSLENSLNRVKYELQMRDLQAELINLHNWVINKKKKLIVIFEGRDAAGKGGAIRSITAHINPRHYRHVALPKPSTEEEGQWYFQRYVQRLPKPGTILFFDRSWYNRAVVEPVNGFCTEEQYIRFMNQVNEFERMIVESETYLIKFYFSITKEEQKKRFKEIEASFLRKWKITPVDRRAQKLWDKYTEYKERMFEKTNTDLAPWTIIDANQETSAHIEALQHILKVVPYE